MKTPKKISLEILFLIFFVSQNQIVDAKSIFIKSSIKQFPYVIHKVKNSFKGEYLQLFNYILTRSSKNLIDRDL
tara:strand:+ start:624 stop:845 length:222 start_codon:yes stop_codon:yes gene_type:complete